MLERRKAVQENSNDGKEREREGMQRDKNKEEEEERGSRREGGGGGAETDRLKERLVGRQTHKQPDRESDTDGQTGEEIWRGKG